MTSVVLFSLEIFLIFSHNVNFELYWWFRGKESAYNAGDARNIRLIHGSRRSPAAAAAKLLQSCPTLCNPIDGSPPGFSIPGILQARTLEWVTISFSNAWKWKVKVKSLSHVRLLATPWTAAYQAPPSMGLSRQEYWSGVPLLSPRRSPRGGNSDAAQYACLEDPMDRGACQATVHAVAKSQTLLSTCKFQ